jgi:hypothetical protein
MTARPFQVVAALDGSECESIVLPHRSTSRVRMHVRTGDAGEEICGLAARTSAFAPTVWASCRSCAEATRQRSRRVLGAVAESRWSGIYASGAGGTPSLVARRSAWSMHRVDA